MTNWSRLRYFALVPKNWLQLTVHNSWGILNVLDIIWLRPMRGGLIDDSHPFCTGLNPATGRIIWNDNVIFRTAPRADWPAGHRPPDPDELIIEKTGDHLRRQVCLAAASAGHPHGRPAPMPPGILYLHGGVHYNGGWLLFNDFEEAIEHFSDARFAAEFRRFVREERREPVSLFRDRDYDRAAFSRFVCFMRTILPWFSNSNGPKKPVLWGNPAPYASVNTITGHWIQDCRMLKNGSAGATRPPIPSGRYFQNGPYHGDRRTTLWPEHLLARLTERRIAWRGARANLYFVDKRKLEHGFRYGPAPILNPAQRLWRILSRQPATRSTKALVIDSQRTSAASRDR